MNRAPAARLRTKLHLLLGGTSVLLLVPVFAASLHLTSVVSLSRRIAQLEAARVQVGPGARPPPTHEIRELRRRMHAGADRAFRDIITLAALSLVMLVSMTLVAPGILLRPLDRLERLVRRTEGGDLRVALDRAESDEVGEISARLVRTLNELARFDDLKQAKIRALAAQRNQLLDLLPAPALMLDGEGRLLAVSLSFRQTFAVQEASMLMQPALSALGWQDAALAGLLASGGPVAQAVVELAGQRFAVKAIHGPGDAAHRLLLFHPVAG